MISLQKSHYLKLAEIDQEGKESPKYLEILADSRALKIPAGPNYSDNFIVSMGLDFTSPGSVPHPNPEREDLKGAPLLLIATSDSVLRFYRLGNTTKSLEGVMRSPLPLKRPTFLPPATKPALGVRRGSYSLLKRHGSTSREVLSLRKTP